MVIAIQLVRECCYPEHFENEIVDDVMINHNTTENDYIYENMTTVITKQRLCICMHDK